ncbi:MAG: hypothetical protein HGB26_04425 [Desulfobulbaceae bacterium]|nr:hypothetical protein [Desulfobulbaceae bacterium]
MALDLAGKLRRYGKFPDNNNKYTKQKREAFEEAKKQAWTAIQAREISIGIMNQELGF